MSLVSPLGTESGAELAQKGSQKHMAVFGAAALSVHTVFGHAADSHVVGTDSDASLSPGEARASRQDLTPNGNATGSSSTELPPLLQLREVFRERRSTEPAHTGIIMSASNQADALDEALPLLLNNTRGACELLVLLDDTSDKSLDVVSRHTKKFLRRTGDVTAFTQVVVYEDDSPLWGAAGETALMRLSSATTWFISLQPDMLIVEPRWNEILAKPAEQYDDVFAVSARCAHNFDDSQQVGRCGRDVLERYAPGKLDRLRGEGFHVRDTCNRGPLLLRADRMRALDFFDIELDSDHDLHCRAKRFGWVSGFWPIDFYSPERPRADGSGGRARSSTESIEARARHRAEVLQYRPACLETLAGRSSGKEEVRQIR